MRALVGILLVLVVAGCRSTSTGPYTPPAEVERDTAKAERLSRLAADVMDANPQRAEELLREALTLDLFYGPAHNNLGVLLLGRAELYGAAQEFEWARKLMPGHPDPRLNLAVTLERAGRTDEAEKSYRLALAVYPGHVPSQQGLASLLLRAGRDDEETRELLRTIALEGETEQWREWARGQQTRARSIEQPPAHEED